jgi:hypothetical protein
MENGDPQNDARERILGRREKVAPEFDGMHRELLDRTIDDIDRPFQFIGRCALLGAKLHLDPRFEALSLLNASLELVISGLHASRQRAHHSALALLRVAVESACVAVHIALEPGAHGQYLGGRSYKSPRAVTFAKARLHRVGELWGGLSRAATHPNPVTFGPVADEQGRFSVTMGTTTATPERDRVSLLIVSLAALSAFRAAELVFLEREPSVAPFLRVAGTRFACNEIAEKLLKDRYQELDAARP